MDNGDFDWNRLGNVELGRENLGVEMPIVVYRLMQYTIMDSLTRRYGLETAEEIIRDAGFYAGKAFAQNLLEKSDDFSTFVANLQEELKNLKIGILRIEKADMENMSFVLTVSEDLD